MFCLFVCVYYYVNLLIWLYYTSINLLTYLLSYMGNYDAFITCTKAEVMRSSQSVCHSVISVCLCVGLLQKSSAHFLETWCYDWAYQSEELINFWW